MEFAIHIIEPSNYDAQHVRDLTKKLAFPIRIVENADIDKGRANIDIVVLGLSSELDVTDARLRLSRVKSICPEAQIVLCTPSDT